MKKRLLQCICMLLCSGSILMAGGVEVTIKGDLDDDLFILKSTPQRSFFLDCMQMHNPAKRFYYDGKMVESQKIYGVIDFAKRYDVASEEILLVMTANEREEIDPRRALLQRSHFKSIDLLVNGEQFIPSMIPEKNDIPDYPLWFGEGERPIVSHAKAYNYYKLWENAIVNLGMVFGTPGRYGLHFVTRSGKILFQKEITVTSKTNNICLLGEHPLTEVDGSVYDGISDDARIREDAIDRVIIVGKGGVHNVKLPYLFPYINRIFVRSL